MAYSQSKKLTDAEKKLQTIRAQLYGKEDTIVKTKNSETPTYTLGNKPADIEKPISKTTTDTSYLKRDLTKIFILATLAIGIQVLLYLGQQQGLIPKSW